MNRVILAFILFYTISISPSSAQKNIAHAGLFHYVSNFGLKDSVYTHRIWFKGDAMIQEAYLFLTCGLGDSIIHEGYEAYKYTYFNLRSNRCQDYFSFSDTASVECNYRINPLTIPPNGIFRKLIRKGWEQKEEMLDSFLQGKPVRIIKLTEANTQYGYRIEENYYFQKRVQTSSIINFDSIVSDRFFGKKILEGYSLVRVDNITYPQKTEMYSDYYVARDSLTENELKIFNQWEKNAALTKLPLISEDEVMKMPKVAIRFKDYPFCNPGKFADKEE